MQKQNTDKTKGKASAISKVTRQMQGSKIWSDKMQGSKI